MPSYLGRRPEGPGRVAIQLKVTQFESAAQMFVIFDHLPCGLGPAFAGESQGPAKTSGPALSGGGGGGHPVLLSLWFALPYCPEQFLALISSVG